MKSPMWRPGVANQDVSTELPAQVGPPRGVKLWSNRFSPLNQGATLDVRVIEENAGWNSLLGAVQLLSGLQMFERIKPEALSCGIPRRDAGLLQLLHKGG